MKRFLLILISLIFAFSVFGCDKPTGGDDDGGEDVILPEYAVDADSPNPVFEPDAPGYTYEGIKTAAPYRVMNEDGTIVKRYDSMFRAIQQAGIIAKSTNKAMVVDQQGYKIFQRQSLTQYWCYDGTYYVGMMETKKEVDDFWSAKPRSYVINGQGTAYARLGNRLMDNSRAIVPEEFEIFSGAYNYMFSKKGFIGNDQTQTAGYGYMRGYVEMSKAHYKPPQDSNDPKLLAGEDGWNAYIFFNSGGAANIDLGFIGNYDKASDEVRWRLVQNCFLKSEHGTGNPNFAITDNVPMAVMTFNEETGDYTCKDDFLFETWTHVNGFILKVTNLTTGVVKYIEDYHTGLIKNNNQNELRTLVAASYCPTYNGGQVWNARSGGYLKDVVFSGLYIARYNASTNSSNPYGIYEQSSWEPFYPGSPNMEIGYSQSGDGASYYTGTYAEGGRYGSDLYGTNYSAGERYTVFNCYYDGSHY